MKTRSIQTIRDAAFLVVLIVLAATVRIVPLDAQEESTNGSGVFDEFIPTAAASPAPAAPASPVLLSADHPRTVPVELREFDIDLRWDSASEGSIEGAECTVIRVIAPTGVWQGSESRMRVLRKMTHAVGVSASRLRAHDEHDDEDCST